MWGRVIKLWFEARRGGFDLKKAVAILSERRERVLINFKFIK